ncbi:MULTISPECIES: hypothetical protein [Streptomyces]|uniref:hypothetical protein n=1 Tax=Streptomyces TaxID=1883 RepID=UPI00131BC7BD|nr:MULTISPECIES: hypothetical protein [Streptomyces]
MRVVGPPGGSGGVSRKVPGPRRQAADTEPTPPTDARHRADADADPKLKPLPRVETASAEPAAAFQIVCDATSEQVDRWRGWRR